MYVLMYLIKETNTEKELVGNSEKLFRVVSSCFHGQKIFLLYYTVHAKKLLDTKVKLFFLNGKIFLELKAVFWGD